MTHSHLPSQSHMITRFSAFWSTHGLPFTDYTLSSLPPSQWAGWKNAVFLWMKLRQRLVPLRVSWLVDRGRIAPHHRNWRQRGIGEGIARSPPQLSVIQKRSKERIQRSYEGTSRCKKNKISFSQELDLLAPQRTPRFTGSSSSDFSARSKTPSIRWWREELSAL